MLQMYRVEKGRIVELHDISPAGADAALWIDMISPTPKERAYIARHFQQPLFHSAELGDIESSARFYEDHTGLNLQSFFFYENREEHAVGSTVAFVIQNNRLFSFRERELSAFRLYRMRAKRQPMLKQESAYELLLDILETKTEQLADEIETVYSELEYLSHLILAQKKEAKFDSALLRLAELEDTSSKLRLCLMDSQRAANFLIRKMKKLQIAAEEIEQAYEMLRDVDSLMPHNESLFQRINFLMQTALGFIDIEQNRMMKVFSALAVLSTLPMLITGWFGMNLQEFFPYYAEHWRAALNFVFTIFVGLSALLSYFLMLKLGWW